MSIIKKTIEYGLYLLAFILPWQTRWIFKAGDTEYLTYSLYSTDVLLILLLVLFAIVVGQSAESLAGDSAGAAEKVQSAKFKVQSKLNIKAIWYLIAGLEFFVFLSIFFAPDKWLALYHYGVFLLGVGLFWLITEADYDKIKLAYSFLGGVFLQACLGIWQFLMQSSFACKWLGLATHDPAELGTSVIETLSGERWLRAYGGLDHPNVLGGLLVFSILYVVYCINSLKFKVQSSKWQNLQLTTCYLLLTTFIAVLFFTFSRGAWAGLIAGLIVMLALAVWQKDLAMQKKLLKVILTGGVAVLILFNLFSDLALTRLSQDTRLEVKSNTERIESMQTAWQVIENHWLLGTGIGNYTLALREIVPGQPAYFYQPVHNVFLLVWSEVGILGIILFFIIILYIAISITNNQTPITKKIPNSKFQIFKFAVIFSILAMFLVDHWWWSLHFGVLLFWLIMGILYRDYQNNGEIATG